MFYETFSWWGLLILCIILGFFQQFGAYGRGFKSSNIEIISNLIMFVTFIISFFICGIWGGIFLILLLVIVNSSITKYLTKKFFRKTVGYVPSDREEMENKVMEESMAKGRGIGSVLEVDQEVRKRLGMKD